MYYIHKKNKYIPASFQQKNRRKSTREENPKFRLTPVSNKYRIAEGASIHSFFWERLGSLPCVLCACLIAWLHIITFFICCQELFVRTLHIIYFRYDHEYIWLMPRTVKISGVICPNRTAPPVTQAGLIDFSFKLSWQNIGTFPVFSPYLVSDVSPAYSIWHASFNVFASS